jgi:1,4-dihydroxy-2-naphthoate octaprenyltransferase
MRIRWSIILPVIGLCWFAAITYQSARRDRGYSDFGETLCLVYVPTRF